MITYYYFIDILINNCYNISTMKEIYDIKRFTDFPTRQTVQTEIVKRFKKRRREQKISQKALAEKSGVAYASIRRFESTGEISFSSLLKLAQAVNCLEDFDCLFANQKVTNLKDYNL